ncbi:hypothetical protein [Methanosarcina sp.]|uniref:hypothetical protein n=1 Tax=Methanosarcina sp. TaxID=2213 RepID=UPI003C77EDB0
MYERTTINVDDFITFCNELLASPAFTQPQKKIICELLEETLKSNNSYGFYFKPIYWVEHGRKKWIDDDCPTKLRYYGYPVYILEIINDKTYSDVTYVDVKYAGSERYSRRYFF